MLTRGEYRDDSGTYGVIIKHAKKEAEVILVENGVVHSAYKKDKTGEYSFLNKRARELYNVIEKGTKGCTAKNGTPVPFIFGTSVRHEFTKTKIEYLVDMYNGELAGAYINGDNVYVSLEYYDDTTTIPQNIPYIKLTTSATKRDMEYVDEDDAVIVRTIEEIALEKEDVTWLNNKKYYIVNDDATAEKIFAYLDKYEGVIAYDTETTGLRINAFSKVNSDYQRELIKWNEENPGNELRSDRLVGVIFCIENDVSYYFPAFNRRFPNLYEDLNSPVRQATTRAIKSKYMIGELRDKVGDMADYIRKTPEEEWSPDIILMERIRKILETKHLVAHNGAFEWRCGWMYEIDTNIKDDTMILHQIMYKFRTTTSNRGEPSNLGYLSRVELGIEQWELKDFFPDFKEDKTGAVRTKGKQKGSQIDFSYMTYEGTRIYAPTDGDVTYQLFMKYKKDLITNHKEQEYLYNVEIMVSQAIAYMEFYGHRIDEGKIMAVRDRTGAEMVAIESEIRQYIKYTGDKELEAYQQLRDHLDLENRDDPNYGEILLELTANLEEAIKADEENVINLNSPAQVSDLFYNKMEIPFSGEKMSVAQKVIKSLLKAKNEDKTNKYPIVHMYSEYKNKATLMSKFFDNLPNFMYPGGIIFSGYGQISTATGRMSCSRPNAQQYPKEITEIVSARPGNVMVSADYSQIEYRVLVALANEPGLLELFKDPDVDYHTMMASLMYGVPYASVTPKMRGDAKSFNFGIPYGMGLGSLAILLTGANTPSGREEAAEKYELYFKDQPNVRKFFDQVKEQATVNKYTRTHWNRYRFYSFLDKDGKESNARKAMALRQAGNAVIQGTAADIFKIAVARNWQFIRANNLFGKLLITNLVHDEIVFEINVKELDTQKILSEIGKNMQYEVNGFPPLYIGAGIGHTWSHAKGKMAEIHPLLLNELTEEKEEHSVYLSEEEKKVNRTEEEVIEYFGSRVYEFRENKVIDYITDQENVGNDIHPAIGNLLNLQFKFGIKKDENGTESDTEFTLRCLQEFINHHDIVGVDSSMFKIQEQAVDEEENNGYDDLEDDDMDDLYDDGYMNTNFELIDESHVVYSADIRDIIAQFGYIIAPHKKVCGIDTRTMNYKEKDALVDVLYENICDANDEGAMQIVFLNASNVLNNTGLWVKGIEEFSIEAKIKQNATV